MAPTPPKFNSRLSQPVTVNNFTPLQSAKLTVSNAGGSGSQFVTFTVVPSTQRVSYKITNSGTKGVYVAVGDGAAVAVVSTGTPTPTTGSGVSTCDYIAAGAIITQDYPGGYDTIAAICAGTDTSTLEISCGYGQ